MTPLQPKATAWGLTVLGAVMIVVPLRLSNGISFWPIVLAVIGAGLLWLGKTARETIAEGEYEQDMGIPRRDNDR